MWKLCRHELRERLSADYRIRKSTITQCELIASSWDMDDTNLINLGNKLHKICQLMRFIVMFVFDLSVCPIMIIAGLSIWPSPRENQLSRLPTEYVLNQSAQLQGLARISKLCTQQAKLLYFRESKQQRRWSDCAGRRLVCAFVVRMQEDRSYVFSRRGTITFRSDLTCFRIKMQGTRQGAPRK